MDVEIYSDRWFELLGRMAWAAHGVDGTLGWVTASLRDDFDNWQKHQEKDPTPTARKAATTARAPAVVEAVNAVDLAKQRRHDILHTSFAVLVHVEGEPGGPPEPGVFPRVGRTRADREADPRRAMTPTASEITSVLNDLQAASSNLTSAVTAHLEHLRRGGR